MCGRLESHPGRLQARPRGVWLERRACADALNHTSGRAEDPPVAPRRACFRRPPDGRDHSIAVVHDALCRVLDRVETSTHQGPKRAVVCSVDESNWHLDVARATRRTTAT